MPGGGVEGWGLHRRVLSRGGVAYARLVLGLPHRDLTGGFKCFRRAVLERLQAEGVLDSVQSVGYSFQIELTWQAWLHGARIGEIPIVFPDRVHGETSSAQPSCTRPCSASCACAGAVWRSCGRQRGAPAR